MVGQVFKLYCGTSTARPKIGDNLAEMHPSHLGELTVKFPDDKLSL